MHLERSSGAISRRGGDPDAFVRSHFRRLEALRREGHVERVAADSWRIPADLAERGQAYDQARKGFGQEVQRALETRKKALVNLGYATPSASGQVRAPKDLIQRLEAADIDRTGRRMAGERGLEWRPPTPGDYVSGTLVGSAQLSSGRFAMIDDGMGFSLVPWRDTLQQHLGRHIAGVAVSGGGVDWSFARSRGLGL